MQIRDLKLNEDEGEQLSGRVHVELNTLDTNWSPVRIESLDGVICRFILFKSDHSGVCKGRYPVVRIPESKHLISVRIGISVVVYLKKDAY